MPASIGDLSVRGVLESSALLVDLSEREKLGLAPECRLYFCEKSEQIWSSGSTVAFFGLVATGFVKMVKSNSGGTEMTLEIMGPGQIFGLLSALEGTGCPLSAVGLTDTVYLRIAKEAFLEIYKANNQLKDRLLRRTVVRMHQKLDLMAKLSSGKAEERIASILFVLAESYGVHGDNTIQLSVPLTRQSLGEMAGTTTETTIRTLSSWAKQKLVQTDQQMISILDVVGLESKLH